MRSGLTGEDTGQTWFVTITAPGADVLPWDPDVCSHGPDVPCSGRHGCEVERIRAAEWNGSAARRWSWFMTYLRRCLGEQAQFVGVWEYQKRGVLHRHFCLRTERPITQRRLSVFVRSCARRWGFGTSKGTDVRAITAASAREVWYVAKYASKTADAMDERPVLDLETGELKRGGVRTWSASWEWGDTIKSVRERQRRWREAARAGDRGQLAAPAAAGDAEGVALDPQKDLSTHTTPAEWGVLDLMRRELGAVLL